VDLWMRIMRRVPYFAAVALVVVVVVVVQG
jgi:hypothetical protein